MENSTVMSAYGQGLNLEDNGHKLEKEGKSSDAAAMYESARSMFQKAWDESNGYEPAKQKMEEMTALAGKMEEREEMRFAGKKRKILGHCREVNTRGDQMDLLKAVSIQCPYCGETIEVDR